MKKSLGAKIIAYPTPVWVIGTYDDGNRPNIMTAAWAGVCCSAPPCVAVSLRKATYTYGNILKKKAFTVNIPSEKHIREVDYCGIVSGRTTDKFAAAGLTPVASALVEAPYVEEFPVVLECSLLNVTELGLHTHFVGEIMDVKADEECVGKDGLPDPEALSPLIYFPEIRHYYGIGRNLGKAFSIGKKR